MIRSRISRLAPPALVSAPRPTEAGSGRRRADAAPERARRARLRDWAELLRVSALFTVPGDALAGAAAVGVRPNRGTAYAVGASLCLYEAGMALNDWADREEDAVDRPHRPVPSGRIAPTAALGAAGLLTAAGLGLAARAGRPAFAVATALTATVWAYDLRLKHTPAGPAAMAAARALDVLLGATATMRPGTTAPSGGTAVGTARPGDTAADAMPQPPWRRRRASGPPGQQAAAPAPFPGARRPLLRAGGVGAPSVPGPARAAAVPARPGPDTRTPPTGGVRPPTGHQGRSGGVRPSTSRRSAGPGKPRDGGGPPARALSPATPSAALLAALPAAAALAAHTYAVTAVSRHEAHGGSTLVPLAALGTTTALGLLLARPRGTAGTAPGLSATAYLRTVAVPCLHAAAYVRTAAVPHLHAALNPSPPLTQRAVGGGIRAMIPLQAALAARSGAGVTELALLGLAPLARRLARKVSVT